MGIPVRSLALSVATCFRHQLVGFEPYPGFIPLHGLMASRYRGDDAVPQSLWGLGIAPSVGHQVVKESPPCPSSPRRYTEFRGNGSHSQQITLWYWGCSASSPSFPRTIRFVARRRLATGLPLVVDRSSVSRVARPSNRTLLILLMRYSPPFAPPRPPGRPPPRYAPPDSRRRARVVP